MLVNDGIPGGLQGACVFALKSLQGGFVCIKVFVRLLTRVGGVE